MRIGETAEFEQLERAICRYANEAAPLPGVQETANRVSLICQIIESRRRIKFVKVLGQRDISAARTNPGSTIFDPLRAAIYHHRAGNFDEACWLVFLATHCGKHLREGWKLVRNLYGSKSNNPIWTWQQICAQPLGIEEFLRHANPVFSLTDALGKFGNHRKYESLRAESATSTGKVVASYVAWVVSQGGHSALIANALHQAEGDPKKAFRFLYKSMQVHRFGRTAKFDYLTMLAKLNLADIAPDAPYFSGATGPLTGARLLFTGSSAGSGSLVHFEELAVSFADAVGIGMQELEDSLCNWQKSPSIFVSFRG